MKTTALLLFPLLAACGGGSKSNTVSAEAAKPVLASYAAVLYQMYSDAVDDQTAFQTSVAAFLASPSEPTLAAARTGWLASRRSYMLTEGARFYDGPIDIDPPNHEAAINSWPLDEAYIDYTTDAHGNFDDSAGIVNNPSELATITVDGLDGLNAEGGDENISDGWHAVEFLLWGHAPETGPGTRPAADYLSTGAHPHVDRRGQYLSVSTQGILDHLTAIREAWKPGATYRTAFESGTVDGKDSLALVLTGLGRFSKGELANQRVDAPYESKKRHDQHDCFSSQTLTDYTRDAQGVVDLYTGKYGAISGPGIDTLITAHDASIAAMLATQTAESVTDMQAIPAPFEASIVGDDSSPGRQAILKTINSLRAQGDLFAQAAGAIGLTIIVPTDNDNP